MAHAKNSSNDSSSTRDLTRFFGICDLEKPILTFPPHSILSFPISLYIVIVNLCMFYFNSAWHRMYETCTHDKRHLVFWLAPCLSIAGDRRGVFFWPQVFELSGGPWNQFLLVFSDYLYKVAYPFFCLMVDKLQYHSWHLRFGRFSWKYYKNLLLQSNLVIRIFLVTAKLYLGCQMFLIENI